MDRGRSSWMNVGNHPAIFSFEGAREDLVFLPLAARRALDAYGAKLTLDAWQALSKHDRWVLVEAGAGASVDLASVAEILSHVHPAPERRSPSLVADEPGSALVSFVEDEEVFLVLWGRLAPLERYALVKLASNPKRPKEETLERVRAAREALSARHGLATKTLTHLDAEGRARMVDVGEKAITRRVAVASAFLRMERATLELLLSGKAPKGDVLATARIAGIQAAKKTSELIPLCHLLALSSVEISLEPDDALPGVRIMATVKTDDRTGVEMEALVAASVAGLTLYDMLKAVDKAMVLGEVALESKSGGRRGDYRRGER